MRCAGLHCSVLCCTGLYWTVLVFTRHDWALVGCSRLNCGVLGCTGQSQQLFVCVFSHFRHGDKRTTEQPGDPSASLLLISVRRQSFAIYTANMIWRPKFVSFRLNLRQRNKQLTDRLPGLGEIGSYCTFTTWQGGQKLLCMKNVFFYDESKSHEFDDF